MRCRTMGQMYPSTALRSISYQPPHQKHHKILETMAEEEPTGASDEQMVFVIHFLQNLLGGWKGLKKTYRAIKTQ